MGSEIYVYFDVESDHVRSAELDELAADSGMEDLPSHGGGQQVVARLSAESKASPGGEVELSIDTSRDEAVRPDRCPARFGLSAGHSRPRSATSRATPASAPPPSRACSTTCRWSQVPTRERVLQAIEELDYRPSTAARGLTSGRWHAVGVVAPFFTSPSAVERLSGVAERLAESEYSLVMHDVETLEQRAEALTAFARPDRVDGLLVISLPLADDEYAALEHDDFPIVMIDVRDASHPDLAIDDVHGGRLATEHLLAAGHRADRLRRRRARPARSASRPASTAGAGYLRALRGAGHRAADGAAAARAARPRRGAARWPTGCSTSCDPPTAIFAASDMQAVGVIEAVRARGLRVPDDVAVIGFDDIELAEIVGLTTVRQPLRESGRRGAELLLARLEDREPMSAAARPAGRGRAPDGWFDDRGLGPRAAVRRQRGRRASGCGSRAGSATSTTRRACSPGSAA